MLRVYDIDGNLVEFEPERLLEYHELKSTSHSPSGTDWEDWDISAIVPEGTRYAQVLCYNGSKCYLGARKDGSSLERKYNLIAEIPLTLTVEVVAGVIEILASATGYFEIWGYWI